ncbi:MAG TPA: DCC1-like thiol-disulfide oxidoreductase family protein [Polyangiaceae bacterium]
MSDLVLYDGVCGLCNRLNLFILKRDRRDRFRFASLQGRLAGEVLGRHGQGTVDLDTVYVIADFNSGNELLLSKARAVLFVLRSLGGIWSLARLLEPLPSRWLDAGYDFIAARRYRWFGRAEICFLAPAEQRSKFFD